MRATKTAARLDGVVSCDEPEKTRVFKLVQGTSSEVSQ